MAISTAQYALTSTATLIVPQTDLPEEVHLHVSSGSAYIGNSDVTTSTGLRLDNGDKITINNGNSPIYAIASASASISVMILS